MSTEHDIHIAAHLSSTGEIRHTVSQAQPSDSDNALVVTFKGHVN